MKKTIQRGLFTGALVLMTAMTAKPANAEVNYQALVDADVKAFQGFFRKEFPDVKLEDFGNGVYALDEDARKQWKEMEEFPPYELDVEAGKALFNKPFANGKSLASCFPNGGAVRGMYPYFDEKRKEVVTLEMAINECRVANGEKPYAWEKGDIARVSAYIASISRGQKVDVKVKSKAAYDAYMKGKKFFYAKRGQLNMSCSGCHMEYAGRHLRAEIISPALGHTTHFPVFRSKWGEIGTLHRRYAGCSNNIGAKPFAPQSEEYRDLEFFQTVMSNGLKYNGPASRK
ncbi:MAG TPA: sulfur oxidation c-type cytochrome SoxA [Chlorobaculum sp.]|uniref:L-cysteine S-thiosulfotransferase subunit SoxA n=1 Tax=Chlorobaculum tepidum (strain ATCC 49652 / DSM 12025 / NBRC 103806 / TLS) TaxID=194439 RepID=SOXA_CHLTE|nr:sulfur oxidation c-type cytochrome SoxA [Chlorobaculum tepidum]Q8KDM7.1 RecName: Full=L-cysteine S-thiosulfotransferase subunit SoxA; AltName: Full=Cytochrome c551 subunit monoheme; AltName: Full=Protein SoxA; AltName: Full=SoxAX cytochrome complex subunit A; AltName: Full=Sulfur oxidizing protein A; AltName: Full=Thiosulfate-oxidizing multienzyme system protein SoxA; Short=TOMES protein SoxA; Flags: Precursor [Chlorobaculum tepidum TLS]AAM72253.1 sulfur oxidation protein SoxA [Chlorobaculum t